MDVCKQVCKGEWCPEADLNHRHADFQSAALPTELSGHREQFIGDRIASVQLFSDKIYTLHLHNVELGVKGFPFPPSPLGGELG